jgi:hypothetical protein
MTSALSFAVFINFRIKLNSGFHFIEQGFQTGGGPHCSLPVDLVHPVRAFFNSPKYVLTLYLS